VLLPDPQRRGGQVFPVKEQEIEQDEEETLGAARVGRGLHGTERSQAFLGERTELAIEIRLRDRKRSERTDDGGVLVGPVEPRSGQEAHLLAIDAGVHPVAVPLQLVDPLAAFGCGFRQRRQLRRNEVGQGACLGPANGASNLCPP
jgi:hypothetical protein